MSIVRRILNSWISSCLFWCPVWQQRGWRNAAIVSWQLRGGWPETLKAEEKTDDGSPPHRSCRFRHPTIRSEIKKDQYTITSPTRKSGTTLYQFKRIVVYFFYCVCGSKKVRFMSLNFAVCSCTSQTDELLYARLWIIKFHKSKVFILGCDCVVYLLQRCKCYRETYCWYLYLVDAGQKVNPKRRCLVNYTASHFWRIILFMITWIRTVSLDR